MYGKTEYVIWQREFSLKGFQQRVYLARILICSMNKRLSTVLIFVCSQNTRMTCFLLIIISVDVNPSIYKEKNDKLLGGGVLPLTTACII